MVSFRVVALLSSVVVAAGRHATHLNPTSSPVAPVGARCAGATACERLEAEESSLLQRGAFPGLDALKNVVDTVAGVSNDVQGRLSEVISKGLNVATSTVEQTLQSVDQEVDALMQTCNATFDKFQAAADINGSLGDNITRFQELLNATLGQAITTFQSVNDKVHGVQSTMEMLLQKLGQSDLAETLNSSIATASSRMSSLTESMEMALSDAAVVTESQAIEVLDKVNSALAAGSESASGFANSLQDSLKDFADGLKKLIAEKLPEDKQAIVSQPLDKILEKASASCEKLKGAVTSLASEVQESSKIVTGSVKAVGQKGFWGHIGDFFSGLR
eukprot:gb/GFBE01001419.1/.p1 GENE.gb/GFBE01001419.1/~~gb/GFBE01001419.1/.p1  ORF type:complete len:332 (+),score=90.92 gb/GFBE01001419.1/:1-996(+)